MQSIFTIMIIFSGRNKHTGFFSCKNAQNRYLNNGCLKTQIHKNGSFLLKINLINLKKYAGYWGLSLFTKEILSGKNNHQRCSIKKGTIKNFVKFTGKHLCQSLFVKLLPY